MRSRWDGLLGRVRRHRSMAILAGLFIIFVPTAWSIFPGWSRWPVWLKTLVLVVWFVAAAVVVIAATRQSERVEDLTGEAEEARRKQREAAGKELLGSLLRHRSSAMEPYCLQLYLPESDSDTLTSRVSSEDSPSDQHWEIGKGATGYAFYTKERAIVRGAGVSDGTYGLSKDEQAKIKSKGTIIVVAMPVKNARGRTIGVLTADGATDDGYLTSPDGSKEHLGLAVIAARLIIDLCGWDTDDEDDLRTPGSTLRDRRT